MYSKRHNLILGFHGCDIKVRNKIVSGEENQHISKNNWDWLGHGMYFWENNPQRALDYAEIIKRNPHRCTSKIETPSVLGAIIDLGHCLDLLDSSFLNMVKEAYQYLELTYSKAKYEMPKNIPIENETDLLIRNLDCAVIEMLHKIYKEREKKKFDSVRSVFFEGDYLYKNSGFKEKNHIQICIINPNCVKGYFIPRERSNEWL
jgi:hypothetical protein